MGPHKHPEPSDGLTATSAPSLLSHHLLPAPLPQIVYGSNLGSSGQVMVCMVTGAQARSTR